MNILITGASGFVGQALVTNLAQRPDYKVLAQTRQKPDSPFSGVQYLHVGDLNMRTQWQNVLTGVDTVVHTAARVHVLNDRTAESLAECQLVNVDVTLQLAKQAAAAGVRRFVFLSSIGVNGVQTETGAAFTESDPPNPHNAYARSKLSAERGLRHIAEQTGLEVVIIRPPLVYGPGVKANFEALLRAVRRGWPLPLGAVNNQRSLVALDNLVDFTWTCMVHPMAANQTFLVSDGHDLSTTELVNGLAQAAGVAGRQIPVPVWMLRAGAFLLGRSNDIQRLCGNLQVDISKARRTLAWMPPISVEQGLQRAAMGVQGA
jgi:nucleoside-diphosphate-sugar epimerase